MQEKQEMHQEKASSQLSNRSEQLQWCNFSCCSCRVFAAEISECCSTIQAAEGSRSRALGNETEHKAKATAEDTAWVMIHLPKHLAQLAAAAPKMANTALIFRLLSDIQQKKEKETSRS